MPRNEGRTRPEGRATVRKVSAAEAKASVAEASAEPSKDGQTWATARYERGRLRVTITASAPYGERSATSTVDVPAPADLRSAFADLLEEHGPKAAGAARLAAARSLVAAADLGEEV